MANRNWKKFLEYVVQTDGNPSLKMAKECGVVYEFEELCMRNIPSEKLKERAEIALKAYKKGERE